MPVDEKAAAAERLANLLVMCEPDDTVALEALAAELERSSELDVAAELREQLRHAASLVRRIIAAEVTDPAAILGLVSDSVADARAALSAGLDVGSPTPDADEALLGEFISRSLEHLDEADHQLLALSSDPSDREALDSVFRSFHTIKGMTGFLSLTDIQQLAHDGEALLETARRMGTPLGGEELNAAFSAVDRLRTAVKSMAGDTQVEADGAVTRVSRTTNGALKSSVRVDASRLDQLLDAVGELVIAESMVSSLARTDAAGSTTLLRQLGRLDKLTRQLHEMAGSLRMVPLRPTFQRLSRAVRDVSHRADKDIELVLTGEETELDRAVVDRIEDPLLHLVRNAVDHGIEKDAAERTAAGKPTAGRIELRAYHKAGNIYVEVEDDGRGLDRDRITAQGVELGLISADQTLSDKDLFGLIFLPGFSTSEVVTDVSGRGVGMDVVKRTVDALSGQITIKSEPGRGTTFVIRLPITLAVIDGMAVRVGNDRYIVPTLSVVRSVRPAPDDVSTVLGKGEVLRHEDELLRLIHLADVFSVQGDGASVDDSLVMVVEDDGSRAGLVIDEILGQQQIVIKSLGEALGDVAGVSGGAVMPDGRVGLILDVEGLVSLADSN